MNGEAQAQMRTMTGELLPLQSVSAKGRLQGLVFELEVEQTYRNAESEAIEVDYTFPIPSRATLLGLEVVIGDKVLEGVAVRRQKASQDYEAAIEQGDTAVLMEQSLDGVYTLSLGNLQAGEDARIKFRYGELVDSFRECVRLRVPTVIAPWYGNPDKAGLQPHEIWGNDPLVEYPFTIEIDILGELSGCEVESSSHKVELLDIENGCRVRTVGRASLDRDFVLNLRGEATRQLTTVCADGDGWIAMASVVVPPVQSEPRPLALKVLVDCSGSMGGPSIAQARQALTRAIERLYPQDFVSLTRFGSTFEHLTPGMVRADEGAGERLRRLITGLEADLGGTEMAAAVEATTQIPTDSTIKDILLITDGQVFDIDQVIRQVESSHHRLFVVSVGSAPAEALGRKLAERTGGAWENVTPGEDATDTIVRMFKRLREPGRQLHGVAWPIAPVWECMDQGTVYGDDTLHLFARFDALPVGTITVTLSGNDTGKVSLAAPITSLVTRNPAIPRIAAGTYLQSLPEGQAAEMAEQYQLAGRYTSYVLVRVRPEGEKQLSLPELRKVAPMLPAGWGGSSSVRVLHSLCLDPGPGSSSPDEFFLASYARKRPREQETNFAFLKKLAEREAAHVATNSPREVLANIARTPESFSTLDHLQWIGVPSPQTEILERIVHETGVPMPMAIEVWIAVLVEILDPDFMSADQKLRCKKNYLMLRELRHVRKACREGLLNIELDAWPQVT